MISPIFRCHHISGSSKRDRRVNTVSGSSRDTNATGKEKTSRRICAVLDAAFGGRAAVLLTLCPAPGLAPGPAASHPRLRTGHWGGSDGADRPGKSAGCVQPAFYF